jgi:LmbE family N-acetylglucosaminyl deacetylase
MRRVCSEPSNARSRRRAPDMPTSSPKFLETAVGPQRQRRLKEFVRLFASRCCHLVVQFTSRPYHARRGKTLVIAPHPDDETLGCGALIARKRNDGQPVHVVFVTDGAASHPDHPGVPPAAIAAIRLQESRRALAVLGVDSCAIYYLNEPDSTLDRMPAARREALVNRLASLLNQVQPDEIFLPCGAEGSSEHEATFRFVIEAIDRTGATADIFEYPVWLWWNPLKLLTRLVLTTGRYRAPTENFRAVKQHALAQYRSQLEPLPPQPDPALPRDLLRLIDADSEYFFPLTAAAARRQPPLPPVV